MRACARRNRKNEGLRRNGVPLFGYNALNSFDIQKGDLKL